MAGKNTHRFKTNPLEKRFADLWEQHNMQGHTLEYILSDTLNERMPVSEDTEIDVATMMQWLGSPVGQCLLSDALGVGVYKHITRELLEEKTD